MTDVPEEKQQPLIAAADSCWQLEIGRHTWLNKEEKKEEMVSQFLNTLLPVGRAQQDVSCSRHFIDKVNGFNSFTAYT